jgi:hypoxanthine phosphoribosyltransferase
MRMKRSMRYLFLFFLLASATCQGDDSLELLISPDVIASKIRQVASQIDDHYYGEEITMIMVMKGAVCVTADLIRQLHIPVNLEYIKASSYGKKGAARSELKITGLDILALEGKNVLIVDDIFDSGNTMVTLVERVKEKNPKSIQTLVLLSKNIERKTKYRPDYVLFDIENRFVVGYGLDYKEYYRGINGIYAFINNTPPQALLNVQ